MCVGSADDAGVLDSADDEWRMKSVLVKWHAALCDDDFWLLMLDENSLLCFSSLPVSLLIPALRGLSQKYRNQPEATWADMRHEAIAIAEIRNPGTETGTETVDQAVIPTKTSRMGIKPRNWGGLASRSHIPNCEYCISIPRSKFAPYRTYLL